MTGSATIVITTKNRRKELAAAIESALAQTEPAEVLVMDDGSTDGTSEMVRAKFPSVRLERSEATRGYVAQRNRAARMARGDILFSLDDDALFASTETVAQTMREFGSSRVGAVAIPYLEPHKSALLSRRTFPREGVHATDHFVGTAHAVRRDVFLQLGGYREFLVHQGEEMDFCIRMLAAGYAVRLGGADPIHHLESPRRDLRRMDFYGCRNSILFGWQNVPALCLPVHLAATTFNCLRWTFDRERFRTRLHGVVAGYRDCFRTRREPVSLKVYRRWRRLKTLRAAPLET